MECSAVTDESPNKCDRQLTTTLYDPVSISNNPTFYSHNHQAVPTLQIIQLTLP